jgi:NADPH:quinone reductase-like Zn-dependent oxidoreductase
MKTAQINKYGGNEVIEINSKVSKPQVEEGKIVVEVHMASINPVDWKIRQGYLAEMMPLQFREW